MIIPHLPSTIIKRHLSDLSALSHDLFFLDIINQGHFFRLPAIAIFFKPSLVIPTTPVTSINHH